MISSNFSNYKDVVHLLRTGKMTAVELYIITKKLLVGLESTTENNAIYRKAM